MKKPKGAEEGEKWLIANGAIEVVSFWYSDPYFVGVLSDGSSVTVAERVPSLTNAFLEVSSKPESESELEEGSAGWWQEKANAFKEEIFSIRASRDSTRHRILRIMGIEENKTWSWIEDELTRREQIRKERRMCQICERTPYGILRSNGCWVCDFCYSNSQRWLNL